MFRRGFVQGLAVACLVGLLSGCASLRAAGAKHKYIESHVESYVYDKPLTTVWPDARQLLFSKGYSVKDTDAQSAETEWKVEGSYRVRYLLTGTPVSETSCRVQFMKDEQSNSGGNWGTSQPERDLGLEWELLQKVSPEAAGKIKSEAEIEAEKARSSS
jgi:hypothetical protein